MGRQRAYEKVLEVVRFCLALMMGSGIGAYDGQVEEAAFGTLC